MKITPMLRQYYDVKREYPGCILLFRLGDFYEMFEDDAVLAAKLLNITLTSREAGRDRRIPMCGVPHHAVESYIVTLVGHGYKVALCEQVEDPKEAKGVVRREVVRVYTPGTVLDAAFLDERENNYLAAVIGVARPQVAFGLAFCDPSTGEFTCTQIDGENAVQTVQEELLRIRPAELLVDETTGDAQRVRSWGDELPIGSIEKLSANHFRLDTSTRRLLAHFGTESLEGFGCADAPLAVRAAGAIIAYLEETQKRSLAQVTKLTTYSTGTHMLLDHATRRNLELIRTLRSGERKGSLLWLLDRTKTAMGSRLMKRWIVQPLIDALAIERRLAAVEELVTGSDLRFQLQEALEQVADIERLIGKVAYGSANGRDLRALQTSLSVLPEIKRALIEHCRSDYLSEIEAGIDPCTEVAEQIDRALVEHPPATINAGGMIREGYAPEVDELRGAAADGKEWLARFEQEERARTGIKSLKVGFNKVFGYYIEVTKPNLSLVPSDYERRQTLANAERFVTPALKEREALILGAEDRLIELEEALFIALRDEVAGHTARLQGVAAQLAQLDVLLSLAEVAVRRRYVRPAVDHGDEIHIRSGRHPIVEAIATDGEFVPNDVVLDESTQVILLTGPNMAGKSTFLRQTALIVLMAQIGSFVPALSARIGVVDRIFTRVGASDDLATGQSTFMVEMNEVANILNHATPKSLIILDEVGRGTSTFDGLSIAWAITEHLHTDAGPGPKTLFATHYHELTELERSLTRLKNFTVAVHKEGTEIHFLRRIIAGGADQSYGIEVARLAGLPASVIGRAREILRGLEAGEAKRALEERAEGLVEAAAAAEVVQVPLFTEIDPLVLQLMAVDVNALTPLEALNLIATWQQEIQARKGAHRLDPGTGRLRRRSHRSG